MVRTHADDEFDRKLLDDVGNHGWHLVGISDDPSGPEYVFSVGIYHTLGQPELCIFGLSNTQVMAQILNVVGTQMRLGNEFKDWYESDDVLEGYSCVFRDVPSSFYQEYFGYALWFYEGPEFPMLQCVWPDHSNRFPWEPEFDARMVESQPVLARETSWPFNEAKNRGVFTTNRILHGDQPIRLVSHDQDGDWQFLCGTTNDEQDGRVVSLEYITDNFSSVHELADLPAGWKAERSAEGEPWFRSKDE